MSQASKHCFLPWPINWMYVERRNDCYLTPFPWHLLFLVSLHRSGYYPFHQRIQSRNDSISQKCRSYLNAVSMSTIFLATKTRYACSFQTRCYLEYVPQWVTSLRGGLSARLLLEWLSSDHWLGDWPNCSIDSTDVFCLQRGTSSQSVWWSHGLRWFYCRVSTPNWLNSSALSNRLWFPDNASSFRCGPTCCSSSWSTQFQNNYTESRVSTYVPSLLAFGRVMLLIFSSFQSEDTLNQHLLHHPWRPSKICFNPRFDTPCNIVFHFVYLRH